MALDLSALKRAQIAVKFGDTDHILAPPTLATIDRVAALGKTIRAASEASDAAGQTDAVRQLLKAIAPTLPADELEDAQCQAVIQHWHAHATGETEKRRADAAEITKDPTSPG